MALAAEAEKIDAIAVADDKPQTPARFYPEGWWRLMEIRIGIVPLPVFLLLVAIIAAFVLLDKISSDISLVIAIMVVGGCTCAEIGKRIPLLRNIGGAAILATFIPSSLVFYRLLPDSIVKSVTDFYKNTNFLYLFITAIIVGSILGMDRQTLIKGFFKIFVPLAAGSIAAMIVGTLVGTALGMGAHHTFLHGRSDYGGRRRRRRDSAFGRLRRHSARGAGRGFRAGSAARDARQFNGDFAFRLSQLRRQKISASHRRRSLGAGRTRRI